MFCYKDLQRRANKKQRLQAPRTPCSLRQSPLMTRPWFWGSIKKQSTTSSRCSCHHAARTWLRWPPGPLNQAYLSSPHLEASPAMTFRACSSPAPTLVKPQLAPSILAKSQSTQRCQSLITPGSDHPPVLKPHRLSLCLDFHSRRMNWCLDFDSSSATGIWTKTSLSCTSKQFG
jgi:hypothetical protein